jgi:hypothetical protein
VIADYGVVLTGEPDEDLVSYDAAATDAARATRPALAEVFGHLVSRQTSVSSWQAKRILPSE